MVIIFWLSLSFNGPSDENRGSHSKIECRHIYCVNCLLLLFYFVEVIHWHIFWMLLLCDLCTRVCKTQYNDHLCNRDVLTEPWSLRCNADGCLQSLSTYSVLHGLEVLWEMRQLFVRRWRQAAAPHWRSVLHKCEVELQLCRPLQVLPALQLQKRPDLGNQEGLGPPLQRVTTGFCISCWKRWTATPGKT